MGLGQCRVRTARTGAGLSERDRIRVCESVKTSVAVTLTGVCRVASSSYVSADGTVATEVDLGDADGSGVHLDFDVPALAHVVGELQQALEQALRRERDAGLDQSAKATS